MQLFIYSCILNYIMQGILSSNELEKLLLACKEGRYRARTKVYKLYSPILLGICLRYTRNKQEAEDVLHEAFIKIYTKIDQAGKGSFEAWMKQIARNEALQFIRKRASLNSKHERYEQDAITNENSVENLDFSNISAKIILELIQHLPDGYRLVFNLYVFEEKTHKEIANILDISEGTSKSQYARAKRKLQKQIIEIKDKQINT